MKRKLVAYNFKQWLIVIIIMAIIGVSCWFSLPVIQSLIIPVNLEGVNEHWHLRPILAIRFGATAIMSTVIFQPVVGLLHKRWASEDVLTGDYYNLFHKNLFLRILFILKVSVLAIVYTAAFVLYLFSSTVIGPKSIQQHLLWITLNHSYDDIETLSMIPDNERSDSLKKNGPWYSVEFKSGRSIDFSLDNEGATKKELHEIANHIAQRSGLTWKKVSDSKPD